MKCRVCRQPAVIDLPRHNANFCARAPGQAVPRSGGQGHRRPRHAHPGGAGAGGGVGRQGQPGGLGPVAGRSATRPTACTSAWASGATATRRRRPRGRSPRSACGCALREVSSRDDSRLRRADRGGRDPPGAVLVLRPLQASPVRCRGPRRADTTWSPPGTTSTTRLPCCSATPCAGTSTTWPASCPCCPAHDGFPRKVKPLVRLSGEGDGGLLHRAGHRLPGRGVPDGRGQPPPRLQGGPQHRRGTLTGHEGCLLPRLPGPDGPPWLAGVHAARASGPGCRRALAAARRPPARCARSADWSNGRPATTRSRSSSSPGQGAPMTAADGAAADGRASFAYGDKVLVLDAKGRRYLATLKEGRRVPHPRRLLPARRAGRPARGDGGQGQPRARRTRCCGRRSRTSWSRCPAVRR